MSLKTSKHTPEWHMERSLRRYKAILAHPRKHPKFALGEVEKAFSIGIAYG
jgi:hypothetical protein